MSTKSTHSGKSLYLVDIFRSLVRPTNQLQLPEQIGRRLAEIAGKPAAGLERV